MCMKFWGHPSVSCKPAGAPPVFQALWRGRQEHLELHWELEANLCYKGCGMKTNSYCEERGKKEKDRRKGRLEGGTER